MEPTANSILGKNITV